MVYLESPTDKANEAAKGKAEKAPSLLDRLIEVADAPVPRTHAEREILSAKTGLLKSLLDDPARAAELEQAVTAFKAVTGAVAGAAAGIPGTKRLEQKLDELAPQLRMNRGRG